MANNIVLYTFTKEGLTPDYIEHGLYFPKLLDEGNNNQRYVYIGVTKNNALEEGKMPHLFKEFKQESEIKDYLDTYLQDGQYCGYSEPVRFVKDVDTDVNIEVEEYRVNQIIIMDDANSTEEEKNKAKEVYESLIEEKYIDDTGKNSLDVIFDTEIAAKDLWSRKID